MHNRIEPKEFLQKINRECDKRRTVFGILILLFCSGILIHSTLFSTRFWDESFYLTIPYRVFLGDSLFVDEWHVSQLSSFLQYLPLWLFIKITGSTDGIILFFRLLFCISQSCTSIFIFFMMKKYGFLASLLSAVAFLLYVPELVPALDYYTMSLMPLVIICMLLFTQEKVSTIKLVFCGVLIACSVVAEPTMALLFFAYTILVLIHTIRKKHQKGYKNTELLTFQAWIKTVIGIVTVIIPFLYYIFSRESISEFFSNMFNIFLSNEYNSNTVFQFKELYVSVNKYYPAAFLPILWLIGIVISKKWQTKTVKLILALTGIALALFYIIRQCLQGLDISVLFFPYIGLFLSLGFLLLTKNRNDNLSAIWGVGFGYIVCLGITSEAMNYVGMYGAVISNLVLLKSMFDFLKETTEETNQKKLYHVSQKIIPLLLVVIVLFQSGVFSYAYLSGNTYRMTIIGNKKETTELCEDGIFKGIRIAQCQETVYQAIISDIQYIDKEIPVLNTIYR